MLEIIVRRPQVGAKPAPLLLVHGFWFSAWCWDELFLPFFAEHGYACYAVSLRGHGASPGRERLRRTRIADYVEDVAQAVAQLPAQPVLIGHSAGGFVVQKYLEEHTAAGAVLLASIPPTGALHTTVHTALHHFKQFVRANLSLSLAPLVATPELARAHFFSASMPREQVEAHQRRLQDDSYAAFLDLLVLDLVEVDRVQRLPMLVLGAENDTLTPPALVQRTARAYGTEAEIFPDMAHAMMLEPGWQAVARCIVDWLDATFPIARPAASTSPARGAS